MRAPAIPSNESARLADLLELGLLDTAPEARFDRIVNLAAHIFHTPISYIALIDTNRQWFKATCNLALASTSRDESFCGHTILLDGPLVIPDALADERFHDNPLVVKAPFIRFYAGYPLRGRNGHNVGTLCLASTEPRQLEGDELTLFSELAALAEHEINLHDLLDTQKQLLATQGALLRNQAQLAAELAEAAAYLGSLLPAPLTAEGVASDWRFLTSSQLGGDLFDYRWLDEHRLAFYLLDVCGHGVGASLLSVSVRNQLLTPQTGVLEEDPGAVLTALNEAFPMEQHGLQYFTIWYGIYDARSRSLRYASGGHPPAVRLRGGETTDLGSPSLPVGAWSGTQYRTEVAQLEAGDRLYLFSDGAYEVVRPAGGAFTRQEFAELLRDTASRGADGADCPACLDGVLQQVRGIQQAETFSDDCSLLEFRFG